MWSKSLEAVGGDRSLRRQYEALEAVEGSNGLEEARGSGGDQKLRRQHSTKLWRGHESSRGGWRLWRQSKALEEVEHSRGSKHEALEETASSGGGRKLWRRI
jgi:hypothetical protein